MFGNTKYGFKHYEDHFEVNIVKSTDVAYVEQIFVKQYFLSFIMVGYPAKQKLKHIMRLTVVYHRKNMLNNLLVSIHRLVNGLRLNMFKGKRKAVTKMKMVLITMK